MNADGYMINPQKLVRHIMINDTEKQLIAQIYWGNLDTLLKTAIDIERKYPQYAGIELNIWCPSPKVMSCGAWSGMLKDKAGCLNVIKTLSEAISLPFSIKTRAWLTPEDKPEQFKFIVEASKYCHMIGIHWRVFKQGHSGDVDWDMISRIKKEVGDSCKIIWNGGIKTYQEHIDIAEQYGLDGVMTAQAAIWDPWIFVPHTPSNLDRYELAVRHMRLLAAIEIYFLENVWPEFINKQLLINRRSHAEKNDDVKWKNLEEIAFHDYVFPMPTLAELENIANNMSQYNTSELRSCIEYRKYLFNYVWWIEWWKEFKREVAGIRDYPTLFEAVDRFFGERII